jgi:hypothetical protein
MRKQTGRKMKDWYGVENRWKNNRKMEQVRKDIKDG